MNDEPGWLIEHRPGLTWWDGRSPETFTPDPNDCVRFARKEDAERVLANIIAPHNRAACIITEHLWCMPAPERDPDRCAWCGWPLAENVHGGCIRRERLAARQEIAALKAAGDLLYLQVLDSNAWINYDGPNGSDLCICHEGKDVDPDDGLPPKPEVHDICCTPFRAALAAWKAARR